MINVAKKRYPDMNFEVKAYYPLEQCVKKMNNPGGFEPPVRSK